MFEPADNTEINSLQNPSEKGFYALIVGDILSESCKLPKFTIFSQSFFFTNSYIFAYFSVVNSLLMTEKHPKAEEL